jgi:hypothetical protein
LGNNPISSPALLSPYREAEMEEMEDFKTLSRGLPGAAPSFTKLKNPPKAVASEPSLIKAAEVLWPKIGRSVDGEEQINIHRGGSALSNPTLVWVLSLTSSTKAMLNQLNSAIQMTRIQVEIAKEAHKAYLLKHGLPSFAPSRVPSMADRGQLASPSSSIDSALASSLHRRLGQLTTDLEYAMISAPSSDQPPSSLPSLRQRAALNTDEATMDAVGIHNNSSAVKGSGRDKTAAEKAAAFEHLKAQTAASAAKSKISAAQNAASKRKKSKELPSREPGSNPSSYQPGGPSMSQLLEIASNRWGGEAASGLPSVAEGDEERPSDRASGARVKNQDRPTPGNHPSKQRFMRGGSLKRMMKNARDEADH